MTRTRSTYLALAAVLLSPIAANAVPIPASSIATPGGSLANGLEGRFADVVGITSGADVAAGVLAAETSPDATFISTSLDYPNGSTNVLSDSTSLATLLGADAGSISGNAAATLTGSMFVLDGFIDIQSSFDTDGATSDIDVNFAVGSDDGFRLYVGNSLVSQFFGNRAFSFSMLSLEFETAGLYDFRLEWWENSGVTGLEVYSSIPGGPDSGAPQGTSGIIPTSVLYHTVPEPGSLALLGIGLFGMSLARRRKV